MTITEAIKLLEKFRAGGVGREQVLRAFQAAPVSDLGFAQVDTHRALRKGFPEVIFGAGKTPEQVMKIAARLLDHGQNVLATRITTEHARLLRKKFKRAVHHELARCVTIEIKPLPRRPGTIAIVCAGTSDLPVAEEASVTAEVMGNRVERIHDAGVAGLHRILARLETIQRANVLVVVAGMEGALPSVVAGLVSKPVIAVPTSVGYGASFGGVAALLGMLNSCGSGVTVVNIDNGFGAGYAASQINALAEKMNPTPTIAEMMAAYALDAVDLARNNFQKELDFSEGSVEIVEGILGQYHDSLPRGLLQKLFKKPPPPETMDQVCKMFGAYIGEIIRRRFGGEWEFDNQISPGSHIMSLRNGDMRIWPPSKVHKRITNGPEDNVWHYFQFAIERWSTPGHRQ